MEHLTNGDQWKEGHAVLSCRSTFIASVNGLYPRYSGQPLSLEEILHTENCAVGGYYAVSSGNFVPTFRDNQSIPSSGLKDTSRRKPAVSQDALCT
jgi:hypothetical protein